MDSEAADKEARPLLQDDETAPVESNMSLLGSVGVGGVADHVDGEDDTRRRRQIPTMVFIVVPMIIFLVGTFLAAAFMPKTEPNEGENNSTHPQQDSRHHHNFGKKLPHDDPITPSLLFVRNQHGLLNVRDNSLYKKMKHATFRQSGQSKRDSANLLSLRTDKNQVDFGDDLTLSWDDSLGENSVKEDDVLALYCPAGEADPRSFRDAATISQARMTHRAHDSTNEPNVWSIPSFPVVREESCQFRLYAHSIGGEAINNEVDHDHHYTLMAATDLISLTSSKDPTALHIGLTGDASEMYVEFVTGDSGEALLDICKKSVIHSAASWEEGRELLHFQELVEEVSWKKFKGSSTSYAATDMCDEPATSTEPGFFVSPGHLHTVKATGLEPDTDYLYRVGLGFGQGIKWSDTNSFRSSPAHGAGSPSVGTPAVTFLALGDQGCAESKFKRGYGPTPSNVNPAQQVTDLIASMIDEETINSIHYVGDLSYADGVAHVWDAWMQMIQPVASRVPVMVGIGNQEYDHSEGGFLPDWGKGSFNSTGGECGVPVSKRFAVPDNGNGVFWYSYDQSLVHTVVLSSEHNLTVGSDQHNWFEKDLASVNRTITPWIIVEMHRPLYNPDLYKSNWLGPLVSEGLQIEIEFLLYSYQVDLVLSGHYHSYFRSCDGLYSYKCSNGGPTFITVGTGGSPLDDDAMSLMPNHYTEFFDKTNWGVGKISVINSTAMHWEFVAVGGNVTDDFWLSREH